MTSKWVGAPYVKDSDTSKAAAESIVSNAGAIRSQIYRHIQAHGERGCTCDEIESQLCISHQTASARIRELKVGGLLDQCGKRNTRSGRKADVHVVVRVADGEAEQLQLVDIPR